MGFLLLYVLVTVLCVAGPMMLRMVGFVSENQRAMVYKMECGEDVWTLIDMPLYKDGAFVSGDAPGVAFDVGRVDSVRNYADGFLIIAEPDFRCDCPESEDLIIQSKSPYLYYYLDNAGCEWLRCMTYEMLIEDTFTSLGLSAGYSMVEPESIPLKQLRRGR
ncbi:MAG: hypothetical protein RLY93_17045 [Sumerlaeia bacterium]